MFRSAASKIAHNTTLPSLGANADLRPLQDLITLEKTVIISLQKLSADYSKAADALRTWGQNEGEDLGNILGASGNILSHFSSALSQYASHGHAIREDLKSIRSREEGLDELKRRRRVVHRKADDAEKKLSKMGPEHKNLTSQIELLNRLKDEIRGLDSEIMTEEAALGDYKRSCTRTWMGLKFGGLLECCEKGTIIGEYGKLLVAEIPEEFTQPGMPRSLFYGHGKAESLTNEALRCISEVSMSLQPPPPPSSAGPPQLQTNFGPTQPGEFTPTTTMSSHFPPHIHNEEASSYDTPRPSAFSTNTLPIPPKGHFMDQPSGGGVDEFGMPTTTQAQQPGISTPFDGSAAGGGGGGRFATFPVKQRQDSLPTIDAPFARTGPTGPPSINTKHEVGSFAAEIADALDAKKDAISDQNTAHSWRGRLSGEANLPPPVPSQDGHKAVHFVDNSWEDTPSQSEDISSSLAQRRGTHMPRRSEDGSAILAYMTANDGDLPDSPESANERIPLPKKDDEGGPPRAQDESELKGSTSSVSPTPSPLSENANKQDTPSLDKNSVDAGSDHAGQEKPAMSHRVPPPTFMSEEEEERAKNVAALKSVSLELKDFSLPSLSFPGSPTRSTVDQTAHPESPVAATAPLAPPSVAFSNQSVSPKPSFESRSAAQEYAQSYQAASSPPAQSYQAASSPPAPSPHIPTASQSIAQSYQAQSQGGASSPPQSSPTRKYPNPYDIPSPTETYPTPTQSNLPPRMQGQPVGDPGIPPRFQAMRAQSNLSSPYERDLPPRFQSPPMDLSTSGSSFSSAQSTPYRTPNEYPNMGTPLGGSSSPPLAQAIPPFAQQPIRAPPSPVISTGTGKISAAAFKRPSPLPGSGMTSPVERYAPGLPSHPAQNRSFSPVQQQQGQYPPPPSSPPQQQYQPASGPQQQQYQSSPPQGQYQQAAAPQQQQQPYASHQYVQPPVRQGSLPYPQSPPQYPQQQQPPPQQQGRDLPPPPGAARPLSSVSDDYGYDYISAYQDRSGQGSPVNGGGDYGRNSQRNSGQQQYGGAQGGGYPQQQQQPPPSLQVGQVVPPRYGGGGGGYSAAPGQPYLPPGAAPSQPPYGSRYGGDVDGSGLR
ncbi:hypothetical protein BKA70DRAFT_176316 [Coprinopsis sp. MPI-PUGE-AT-0042]|nr:hypothetical protein BKA70DRAFT_176316 [Coprinopsis sp. MPI-PUGE-AT-0042]